MLPRIPARELTFIMNSLQCFAVGLYVIDSTANVSEARTKIVKFNVVFSSFKKRSMEKLVLF